MSNTTITIAIVILGECCLLLDLGNRLFGCYARTLTGAMVRILVVVLACVLLALPLWGLLLVPDSSPNAWSTVSVIAAVVVIGHYLFPYRFGIQRIQSPTVSENHQRLTDKIDLHNITLDGRLPPGRSTIACLVLSDLHCNTRARLNTIAESLASLEERTYDLVFVLGDLGENNRLIPDILKLLASVKPKHGVFLVRSNHDCEHGRKDLIARLTRDESITVLANMEQPVPELGISLIGLEYPWCRGPLPKPTEAPFAIGLTHTPDNVTHFSRIGVPFVLAGHTHGGRLRLPLIGSLLVPSRWGRFLDAGWFQLQNTAMYITTGVGYFPGVMGKRGTLLEVIIRNKDADTHHRK
jgi:predicted MPP superfamily phosphohydrolase